MKLEARKRFTLVRLRALDTGEGIEATGENSKEGGSWGATETRGAGIGSVMTGASTDGITTGGAVVAALSAGTRKVVVVGTAGISSWGGRGTSETGVTSDAKRGAEVISGVVGGGEIV